VTELEGDYDMFGDGSATIISTLGHTPGHQSLRRESHQECEAAADC
jgi:glyoxylase-like metal-dependent hydrolase (beta-lactamase superfamily II)